MQSRLGGQQDTASTYAVAKHVQRNSWLAVANAVEHGISETWRPKGRRGCKWSYPFILQVSDRRGRNPSVYFPIGEITVCSRRDSNLPLRLSSAVWHWHGAFPDATPLPGFALHDETLLRSLSKAIGLCKHHRYKWKLKGDSVRRNSRIFRYWTRQRQRQRENVVRKLAMEPE